MSGNLADFSGNIPENYDSGMGPVIFAGYATDMARRVASSSPSRVLETAAGTGIVTRALRDAIPADAHLTATDLNVGMEDIARTKFRSGEDVVFQAADATALPFPDASFDAVVCVRCDVLPGQGEVLSGSSPCARPRWALSVQRMGFTSPQRIWADRARSDRQLLSVRSTEIL